MSFGHAAESYMHRVGGNLAADISAAWARDDRRRAAETAQAARNEAAATRAVAAVDKLTMAQLREALVYAYAEVAGLRDEVDDLEDELASLRA